MIQLTLAVLIVIIVSAMCSLFEAVLYAVPASHIEILAQSGSPAGKILQRLRQQVDAPIAAILSLNTIANTAGAAVAGAIAANVLGSVWLGLFSACFTMAILFFSEVVPKTVGVIYARSLAEWIARPLQWLVWLFKPLIWLLGLATEAIAGKGSKEEISGAELMAMAQMGVQKGIIQADEEAVIKNILLLEDTTVQEVMTPRTVIFALPDDCTVEEVIKDRQIYSYSRFPVYANNDIDNVIGIAHRRDILWAVADDQLDVTIDSLIKPVHFVFERTALNEVLKKFLELHRHMFVVLGEFGDMVGIITLEDVLETILGQEIMDESDKVADLRALAKERRKQLLKETSN